MLHWVLRSVGPFGTPLSGAVWQRQRGHSGVQRRLVEGPAPIAVLQKLLVQEKAQLRPTRGPGTLSGTMELSVQTLSLQHGLTRNCAMGRAGF